MIKSELLDGNYYYIPNDWDLVLRLYESSYIKKDENEYFSLIQDNNLIKIPNQVLSNCNLKGIRKECDYLIDNKKEYKRSGSYVGFDLTLSHTLHNSLRINHFEASKNQFWNGITLSSQSFINFIEARWKLKRNIFPKNESKKVRFISGSGFTVQRRHTLARIWWAYEFVKNDKDSINLLFGSQDAMDRILETDFLFLDYSHLFFEACKRYQQKYESILGNDWQYIVRFGKHLISGKNIDLMSEDEIINSFETLIKQVIEYNRKKNSS